VTRVETEPELPAPSQVAPRSLIARSTSDDPGPGVGSSAAGLSRRRRWALGEIAGELGPARHRGDQPTVAVRDYGPGYVCLGIAGPVDRAMAERLQALLRELRGRAHRELVITLAGLGPWHPQLARVLAHARIQHLVDGAHVELHDVPEPLAAELGPAGPTTFLVEDTTPPTRSTPVRSSTTTPARPAGARPPSGPAPHPNPVITPPT
jgi:hypothetical protein